MVFADPHIQGWALYDAVGKGNLGKVQALLAQGADVNWVGQVRTNWVIIIILLPSDEEDVSMYKWDFK